MSLSGCQLSVSYGLIDVINKHNIQDVMIYFFLSISVNISLFSEGLPVSSVVSPRSFTASVRMR